MNGRAIHVDFSTPREQRPSNGGFSRGGDRGFSRGGDRGGNRQSFQPRNDTFQGEIVDL